MPRALLRCASHASSQNHPVFQRPMITCEDHHQHYNLQSLQSCQRYNCYFHVKFLSLGQESQDTSTTNAAAAHATTCRNLLVLLITVSNALSYRHFLLSPLHLTTSPCSRYIPLLTYRHFLLYPLVPLPSMAGVRPHRGEHCLGRILVASCQTRNHHECVQLLVQCVVPARTRTDTTHTQNVHKLRVRQINRRQHSYYVALSVCISSRESTISVYARANAL